MIDKRLPVLDKIGYVEILDTMPAFDGDGAVVQAARVTHLQGSKGDEKDGRLLDYLMRNQHTSPFEMVEFKFRVKAPLVVFWQWVRHRTFQFQSINSQSGRYSEFSESEVYQPYKWRKQSTSNHQGSSGLIDDNVSAVLDEMLADHYKLCFDRYTSALEAGVAKEMARLFLPAFAVYYTWLVKVDMHNLFAFLKLRLADDVQDEMYEYAEAIFDLARPYAPKCFELFLQYHLHLEVNKTLAGGVTRLGDKADQYKRFRKALESKRYL